MYIYSMESWNPLVETSKSCRLVVATTNNPRHSRLSAYVESGSLWTLRKLHGLAEGGTYRTGATFHGARAWAAWTLFFYKKKECGCRLSHAMRDGLKDRGGLMPDVCVSFFLLFFSNLDSNSNIVLKFQLSLNAQFKEINGMMRNYIFFLDTLSI